MGDTITAPNASSERSEGRTRALLLAGAIAGPLYLVVGLIEAFTRPGFDIRRHDLSLLANGDLGWIHVTLLIVSGPQVRPRSGCAAGWHPAPAGPGVRCCSASTGS